MRKQQSTFYAIIFLLFTLILIASSCKKEDDPISNPDPIDCPTCEVITTTWDKNLTSGESIVVATDTNEVENCDDLLSTETTISYGDIQADSTQLITYEWITCE